MWWKDYILLLTAIINLALAFINLIGKAKTKKAVKQKKSVTSKKRSHKRKNRK